ILRLLSYAYHRIRTLSLPIPTAYAIFSLLLPAVTGFSIRSMELIVDRKQYISISGHHKDQPHCLPLFVIAIFALQLIYESVMLTLAFTYMVPTDALDCGLDQQWLHIYQKKDG